MTCNWKFALSIFALTALPMLAGAQRLKPIPHPIGAPQGAKHVASAAKRGASGWTPLANQPAFLADGASNPILLTDGTVLIQDAGFPDWWKLTPDQNGSYIDGTWSQIASLPASYSPLYHSTAVLPDGRMIIEGGEYLLNSAQTAMVPTWTAKGAIYDPLTNLWTPVVPPAGWQSIGDAQSVVLPNGTYMQADCCATDTALLNARTLTWTPTGANKFDANDEEGWNLLPNGQVLAVDAYVYAYNPEGTNSELYDPASGTWRSAGSTIVQLWDSAEACGGEPKATFELGPAVLRPDGTVFYTGANTCGAANTSIYNTHNRSWSPGPQFPDNFSISDGPATLETDGNVLMMASPSFAPPSQFFEWNGRSLTAVANPRTHRSTSPTLETCSCFPPVRFCSPTFRMTSRYTAPSHRHGRIGRPSSCTLRALSLPVVPMKPRDCGSTVCLRGLPTEMMCRPRPITRWSALQTSPAVMFFTAAHTITAAWPWHQTRSSRLTSIFQAPRRWGSARWRSSPTVFPHGRCMSWSPNRSSCRIAVTPEGSASKWLAASRRNRYRV